MKYKYRKYKLNVSEFLHQIYRRKFSGLTFRGSWRIKKFLDKNIPYREVICETRYGFRIIVNPSMDDYQRVIFEYGSYEPGTLSFMKCVLRPGDVFVDIGANIGVMSLAASQFVGESGNVYAFEPEPSVFVRLLDNIDLNAVKNIDALPMAVGAVRESRALFAYPSVSIGRASLVKSDQSVPAGQIPVIALSDFVRERGLERIRMIKIDVERFEREVLQGAYPLLCYENAPILNVECDEEMPRESTSVDMSSINEMVVGTGKYEPFMLQNSKYNDNHRIVPVARLADVRRHDNILHIPKREKTEILSKTNP